MPRMTFRKIESTYLPFLMIQVLYLLLSKSSHKYPFNLLLFLEMVTNPSSYIERISDP